MLNFKKELKMAQLKKKLEYQKKHKIKNTYQQTREFHENVKSEIILA